MSVHSGRVERDTRSWLTDTFHTGVAGTLEPERLVYDADGQPRRVTPAHFGRLVRKLKILRWLDRLEFRTFVDVASGWEHVPHLVTERYGVPAFYCDMVHELNLPTDGLVWGKLDHAVTMQLPALPFKDDAFDVVLCSEVFEHLVRPVEAMAELLRVARRYVVLTTLEGLSPDRWRQLRSHFLVDVRVPHVERNFLVLDEFRAVFGDGLRHENLLYSPGMPRSLFDPPHLQAPAYAALDDRAKLERALCRAVAEPGHGRGAMGIVLVKPLGGATVHEPRPDADPELARWLVEKAFQEQEQAELVLAVWEAFRRDPSLRPKEPGVDRPVATSLLAYLQCPDCHGELVRNATGGGLRCPACDAAFASEYGVPMLYPRQGRSLTEAECLDRICGTDAARRRIVRRVLRRLRRNEAPPGRFRRTLWSLAHRLGG